MFNTKHLGDNELPHVGKCDQAVCLSVYTLPTDLRIDPLLKVVVGRLRLGERGETAEVLRRYVLLDKRVERHAFGVLDGEEVEVLDAGGRDEFL